MSKESVIDTIATVERNDLFASTPQDQNLHPSRSRHYGFLRLRLPQSQAILPGQFAMLKKHGIYEPLLRRAMAYYRVEQHGDSTSVEFIYQILGRGTEALATMRVGERVDYLGALGNTYDLTAARGKKALLVVGGVGSAAVFMLAEELQRQGTPTRLFIGGASRGDLLGYDDFIELLGKENCVSATVDGSDGERGFVTAPLERHLRANAGKPMVIYSCGPDAMLHATAKIAAAHHIPAQLSLEAPMACGIGICVGCAVAVKHDCAEGFVYKKVCTEGPIFWHEELHW
ncbi:MAG TPA: dihydroorotate dehydrogenase electron transfer subunit [Blastocatellia bacterium]|nr:dihydroorotate dehydrogenase electron transfer subunit [Blastocatellia bacterium]